MKKLWPYPLTALLLFLSGTISIRFHSFFGLGLTENLCREIESELSKLCSDVDKIGYIASTWPLLLGAAIISAFFTAIIMIALVSMGFGSRKFD